MGVEGFEEGGCLGEGVVGVVVVHFCVLRLECVYISGGLIC